MPGAAWCARPGHARSSGRRRYAPSPDRTRAIATDLPTQLRRLFLIGCGALPGAWPAVRGGARVARQPVPGIDPRPDLYRLSCPVTIVHGIADDVIPFAQAGELERALPSGIARPTLATGMFAHSNTVALTSVATRATAIARELVTFNRICSTLTRA
jgi:fermentation-respiration switch protein FrsA (DUF1100 family)